MIIVSEKTVYICVCFSNETYANLDPTGCVYEPIGIFMIHQCSVLSINPLALLVHKIFKYLIIFLLLGPSWAPSLDPGHIKYNLERGNSKDHSGQVWFKFA